MVGGYRSAAAVRRAVLPPSPAPAESRKTACTFAVVDDWIIPDRELFGPVPTHEEAMAATLDLKDAFQFATTESNAVQLEHLSSGDLDAAKKVAQVTALQDLFDPEISQEVHSEKSQDLVHTETLESSQDIIHSKTSEHEDSHESSLVASGAHGRVVQAFAMLHESPEAQDVVASLASDMNVWNAVLRNEKVMQFYKAHETKLREDEAEVSESDVQSSCESATELASAGAFMDCVEKMKALVSEMVTNLSSIMQDLVATSNEGQSKGKLKTMMMDSKRDFANAPSAFVLLAIASIMVVLLKRA
uniref:Uncharacterized protein n=1 Tax=Leersia perrieri TaxID=77586 RepID=A0A0D9VQU5_9ORYZ